MARYTIVPERSQVWIDARSNLHPIHSATNGLEGYVDLELDPDGAVDVTHAPTGELSLAVDKLKSGNRMEDREMQRRINARRYPAIVGELGGMAQDGTDGTYRVNGSVTFRGVSRQHEDLLTISEVDEHTIRLAGASRFDIRDFGMQPPKVLLLRVEPEVEVRIEIFAVRDGDG